MHAPPRPPWRRRVAAAAATSLLLAGGLAACGSDSGDSAADGANSSGSSSTASDSAGVADANQVVKQYSEAQTSISINSPVGKPIPAGKKIIYIHCGVTGCNAMADAITDAGNVLGWTTKVITTNGTPEGSRPRGRRPCASTPPA